MKKMLQEIKGLWKQYWSQFTWHTFGLSVGMTSVAVLIAKFLHTRTDVVLGYLWMGILFILLLLSFLTFVRLGIQKRKEKG